MRKAFIVIGILLGLFLYAHVAQSACTVTVTWTPSTDPAAVNQEVYYDPDNTVSGDEVRHGGLLDMTVITQSFSIAAPAQNDEVYVRTLDAGGNYADSAKMPVGGLSGATGVQTITICQ